jgi:pyruvate formate lyase activating enzyme
LGEHFRDYDNIERVEILPYHRLGVHKYEAMGWEYQLREVVENTPEQLERARSLFEEYFPKVVVN